MQSVGLSRSSYSGLYVRDVADSLLMVEQQLVRALLVSAILSLYRPGNTRYWFYDDTLGKILSLVVWVLIFF